MNKKGLSILLALSMVFSLNTMAFAEEAVVSEEAVVEAVDDEAAVTEEDVEVKKDYDDTESYNSKTVSVDSSVSSGSARVFVGSPIVDYTGSKVTATDLGVWIEDTTSNYSVPASKIKLTGNNKKATAAGEITYKVTGIKNWKYVYSDEKGNYSLTTEEAKAAYKQLKANLKTLKNTELKAYIKPHYIYDSISSAKIKTLKKTKGISTDDLIVDGHSIRDMVVVNVKNGSVKSVQLPVIKRKNTIAKNADGTSRATSYKLSISLKKLKKGQDYTVSGDVITFKDSERFSGVGSFKTKD
jgi:hypothetical protein